jgi:hypothetical protein
MSFIRRWGRKPQGAAVRFLPEEQLVRRAVLEGVGRGLREVYTEQQVGPLPEQVTQLLARFQ